MPKIFNAPPGFVMNPVGLTDELRGEIARLHGAVCQAVALLNRAPEVARCEEAWQAHTILREVLVSHADAYMDEPVTEREREAVAAKHRRKRA